MNKYSKDRGGMQMYAIEKGGEGKCICCKSVEKYIIHPKSFWGVTYVKKGPSKASVVFSYSCSHQYVFAIFNTCQSDKFFAPL